MTRKKISEGELLHAKIIQFQTIRIMHSNDDYSDCIYALFDNGYLLHKWISESDWSLIHAPENLTKKDEK